ncbi:MarR family transcriptional regulator [Opitutaceae bacterium EW11]|nr:MarR family transcriptional regulator [Opitutaceae bacterium EW11]
MPHLLIKDLPRYECLLGAAQTFPDLDPSACEVFMHVLRAGDEAFRVADDHLACHHISPGRFTVLLLLLDKAHNCPKAHTPAELADMAGVTRATMTGLVDTLERDGFVTRTPDPNDRRMMSVSLTEHGKARLEAILPGHFRRMAMLVATLDENERRTLVRLLTKILEKAAEIGKPTPASATPDVPPAASARS